MLLFLEKWDMIKYSGMRWFFIIGGLGGMIKWWFCFIGFCFFWLFFLVECVIFKLYVVIEICFKVVFVERVIVNGKIDV